ncbi:Protein argonaute 7, partial [Ananas comosus]
IEVIQEKANLLIEKESPQTAVDCLGSHERPSPSPQAMLVVRRPDSGGTEGPAIPLLANHFLVQFDPSQKIFHYDVTISPQPSKEVARMIKRKLVEENSDALSGSLPVFDGRRSLYSPVEFEENKLEFFVNLPLQKQKHKLFRVNIRLAAKLSGEDLNKYLNEEGEDGAPLPQDYLQALDVVLRESSTESCIPLGRSLYSSSMGGAKELGGGAVGLRGFFQSLRPTKQGLSLNVDFSVTAFHESVGIIAYLQKRCDFLKDLSQRKNRGLIEEEKREVEKALKNIRVFVCHRETEQRYKVFSLTDEATEKLKFRDRSGRDMTVVDYFKDQYNHDIQFRNLPCLQISRSKPCYLPMELCVVCEGQKFLGKLSDEQTARILKMGCQRPGERKDIIKGVVGGELGPTSGSYANQFKLQVSREMTQLCGRVLQPPKLKFGDGGHVKDITPNRHDRQWNLLNSHVAEASKIRRWALISFGGSPEQHFCVPKFINQLSNRCEQLGILLNKNTIVNPLFEHIQLLNNVASLEIKLRKIQEAASGNLQLLICVMEKKHKGYADLKRIAETCIGVVSQCCLYSNLSKLTSQFLANLALKINAKLGGCNVALYNTLPRQIPRIFSDDEPVMFMGADVTHPHPLDDYSPSVVAVVGSMNWPAANKYISRMRSQTHRKEIIESLDDMVVELFEEFLLEAHKLPSRIIFFRDGVSETMFYKVLKEELQAIKAACSRFPKYKPSITFIVVQKRHHTRLFLNEENGLSKKPFDENIPPGTVVDTVITHPTEFDFYLCSHWGMKGTSRPTHYHVLWDENHFNSDEAQKLIHNLCYTFVRCTKPVSIVPPAYYAHLAAYRGRLYLERSDYAACTRPKLYRNTPLQTTPLPKLRDNVSKLMFYC